MKESPAFIFDLGKVLVDFDYTIAARKVAARSHKPPADLHAFLSSSPLLIQFESGKITRQGFYEGIRDAIGCQVDWTEWGGYFADIFAEMPEMIALQQDLRRPGFKAFIFSNTNDQALEHFRRNFPFFNGF